MTTPNTQAPPSPAAAAATVSLVGHAQALQSVLTDLTTLTVQQLVALFRQYATHTDFPQLLKTVFPQIVEPHADAAASITAQWYDELAPGKTARPVVDLAPQRIQKTIDWALYAPTETKPPPGEPVYRAEPDATLSRLSGSAKRMVFDASRTTVIENSTGQTRYARYASANACAFCRLLAVRSDQYLYRSAKSAQFVGGKPEQKFHDHCRCIVVPIEAGQSWEAPDYVGDWQKQYQAARDAVGGSTGDILAYMRADTGTH